MQAAYFLGSNSIAAGANRTFPVSPWNRCLCRQSRRGTVAASAIGGEKNHYTVLGVSDTASLADIKRAYRLLALKYHPDVSKDSRSDDMFKSIHLAYEVLSCKTSRNQYDRSLKFEAGMGKASHQNWSFNHQVDDEIKSYRWADLRRRMRYKRYREKFNRTYGDTPFEEETDGESEEKTTLGQERGSLIEVIKSAFLSLFLLQTIGARLSLTFSALSALFDQKLDNGYKMGYLIAWVLGGRAGVLLTLCLSFASWVFGKTSSSIVTLVGVAIWVGSNIARYAPLPQGALLTLLYMSIKLQSDIN